MKKLEDMTDEELFTLLDMPEGEERDAALADTDITEPSDCHPGELMDIISGVLDQRHGDGWADAEFDKRYC